MISLCSDGLRHPQPTRRNLALITHSDPSLLLLMSSPLIQMAERPQGLSGVNFSMRFGSGWLASRGIGAKENTATDINTQVLTFKETLLQKKKKKKEAILKVAP